MLAAFRTFSSNHPSHPPTLSVTWEPFFLNRDTKPEGEDMMEHLTKKYGPSAVEKYGKPGNPLDVAGSKVGITFNPARRVIQTLNCHRVMEAIEGDKVKSDEFMDKMFEAYFTNARDLSKLDVLLDVIEEAGLDKAAFRTLLESGEHTESVMAKDEKFKKGGVSGVPFFILGGYKFSGAQPPETFEEVFEEMYNRL